jgi:tetratricopeptide (TPR) repeat protein
LSDPTHDPLAGGVAAAEQGRVAEGLALIRAACAARPEDPETHAQLARWLSRLHRTDAALESAERALALTPRSGIVFDTVGVVFSRAGLHERAVACFDAAVLAAPQTASFHLNRASSLKFLGRFDDAAAAYEACLERDPRCWRAYSARAATRRPTIDRNDVTRLESLLRLPGLDAYAELHLRHALARELEGLGRELEAFDHYAAGNARVYAQSGHDPRQDQALFEQVQRLFPESMPPPDPDAHDAPVFVVGMPRTGTTLVERMLSSHPDVASAGESQNFGLLLKRACRTSSPRVLDVETLQQSQCIDAATLGREYLARTRPAGREPRFVDKMPLNFFYLGHIARALPGARIVVVRRHPLDTALSNFRQLFATRFTYYDYARDLGAIGHYYACYDRLMAHWRRVLPGRVLELQYESLVAQPEAEVTRLLAHCGLPWSDACLAFERNPQAVATASAVQVRRPLYAEGVGRWRRYVTRLAPVVDALHSEGVEIPG